MSGNQDTSHVKPLPAHPLLRKSGLPWETPKPDKDEPAAKSLIEAILRSPEYREADKDVEFLTRDETRGLRLQLDYLKAQTLLEEHGITHSIVVFGSTRVPEPEAARSIVEDIRAQLAQTPQDRALAYRLQIAQRVLEKSRFYQIAQEFGQLVGQHEDSSGKRIVVVTGGGPGMMEAANRGARDAGAKTVGLNITLPHEQFPNPYVTPGLCFRFHYFGIRKMHFLLRARALVVFPGGYGTLDELFETLTLIQTRKIEPVPVILVGEDYWRRAFDPDFLVNEGVIDPEDRDLFWYAESAEEIWSDIQRWHELAGNTLAK
jgi:uncharacterized protein (TIGR00730 family)